LIAASRGIYEYDAYGNIIETTGYGWDSNIEDWIAADRRVYKSDSNGNKIEGLSSSIPSDLLAQDIREALHYLGEITGEVTTDEILGNIFKNFCIGK